MKKAKRLTRAQKIVLAKLGHDPKKYRMLFDLDTAFVLVDKATDERVVVKKLAGK